MMARLFLSLCLWLLTLMQCSSFSVKYALERVDSVESRLEAIHKLRRADLAEIFSRMYALDNKLNTLNMKKGDCNSERKMEVVNDKESKRIANYLLKGAASEKLENIKTREMLTNMLKSVADNSTNNIVQLQNIMHELENKMATLVNKELLDTTMENMKKQWASEIESLRSEMELRINISFMKIVKKFLNFAAVQPAKRPGTSLACCPIPEPEGPYTTAEITTAKQIEFPAETTTTMALPPPGRCALDVVDPVDVTEDDQRGYYFGAYPNSRLEYDRLPVSLRIIATLSMEFRTTQPDGVMFYFSDVMHRDHIGVTMKGGMIRFTFDSGTGTGELMTTKTYNDGHWHKLMIGRNMREGTMMVDDDELTPVESAGRARTINGRPPYSFGGLRESPVAGAVKNLNGVTNSFAGCIANIKLNNRDIGAAPVQNGTLPCSDFTYNGAYFYNDGGYIKLMDSFNVKKKMTMSVEIRPRSLNGVIFSVYGKRDFLILQLVEGELWFTAENYAVPFTAKYIPEMNNKLCDGAWHTIKAEKIRNVVILAVDDKESITEISAGRATSAHTNSPIYLGGKPDDITKGVRAKGDYKGCMRNLSINGKYQYLNTGIAFKDVSLDSCPVN